MSKLTVDAALVTIETKPNSQKGKISVEVPSSTGVHIYSVKGWVERREVRDK